MLEHRWWGDNHAVLQGKTVTTLRRGGLGVSLRSKAPLFDASGQVIGIVSVGYLKRELDTLTLRKILTSLMVFSSLLGLLLYSRGFLRAILKSKFSLWNLGKSVCWSVNKSIFGVDL